MTTEALRSEGHAPARGDGPHASSPPRAPADPLARRLAWINLAAAAVVFPVLLVGVPGGVPAAGTSESGGAPRVALDRLRTESRLTRFADIAGSGGSWAEGRRRYFETVVLPPPGEWRLPPAGQPGGARVDRTLGVLSVEPRTALRDGLAMQFTAYPRTEPEIVVTPPVMLGPFAAPRTTIYARFVDTNSGSWFTRQSRSEWYPLEVVPESKKTLTFARLPDWVGTADLVARWRPMAFDAPDYSGAPSSQRVEAIVADGRGRWLLPGPAAKPEVVSIDRSAAGATARAIEVSGARRVVALFVWSATGTLPEVRARRTDTGALVGARAPGLPLFAAVTDAWSSVWLELIDDPGQPSDDVRLLAFTHHEDPGMRVFLEAIGQALPTLRVNSVPAKRATQITAGLWLRDVLGVSWTARDVAELKTRDRELALILEWIGQADAGRRQ